jgi:prepilin-type N-terminal cleavage/methylation domain-containing protein
MSRRLSEERGWTFIELLVAMTLMLIILTATLTSFDTLGQTRTRNERLNDAQEVARRTIDRLAQQLRNLANPSNTVPNTIDTAAKYRLIFQTTDPSKRWVGYCLATSGNGAGVIAGGPTASTESGVLYMQTSTSPTAPTDAMRGGPAAGTDLCPAQGWATTNVQAQNVVNKRLSGGSPLDRPVFTYSACASGASSCLSTITDINSALWIDTDTRRRPREVSISTGVFLRNQNQSPTAAFTATQSTSDPRTWLLNATISTDPEGRTLQSLWYKGPAGGSLADLPDCISALSNAAGYACIGDSPLLNTTFPGTDGNSKNVYLKVTDPGGLVALCTKTISLSSTSAPVTCP